MKISLFSLVVVLIALVSFSSQQSLAGTNPRINNSMIVSTDWLSKHLNDNSLVLLQVGDKSEYDAAHIAGAQYIQLADISTPRGTGLILELPPVD